MLNFLGHRGPLMDGEPAPAGGGTPPVFDQAAFDAKFTAFADGVTKMLNGFDKKLKAAPATPPPTDPPVDPPTDPPAGGKPKDPELAKALKQLSDMSKSLADEKEARVKTESAAREKERVALIRTELSKHGLAEHSTDDAFRYFRDEIKFNEAGELVGGSDETPLADFVKAIVDKRQHWLPPKAAGGAGATGGGRQSNGISFDQAVGLIKPGMSKEDDARVRASLMNAAAGLK